MSKFQERFKGKMVPMTKEGFNSVVKDNDNPIAKDNTII